MAPSPQADLDKSYTCPILWISLCGRISTATVYEYNNLFLLVLKWRKPLRNHIERAAKKLGGQNLWRIRARKDWLCVMCQQEKEQMLELPPLMTNKQILTHTRRAKLQKRPHFLPLSHEAGQKERDILWLRMMARWWSGKERSSTSRCLFVSVLAELLFVFVWGTLSRCLSFWTVSCFPSPVSLGISVHNIAWDSNGMRTWVW